MSRASGNSSHHWLISNAIFAYIAQHDPDAAHRFRQLYPEPCDQSLVNQMATANHFWRMQLVTLPVDTIRVRECLLQCPAVDEWLCLFAHQVLPTILQYQLPRDLSSFEFPALETII